MNRKRAWEIAATGALVVTVGCVGGGFYHWHKQREAASAQLLALLQREAAAAQFKPSRPSRAATVRALIKRGADANTRDSDGYGGVLWYALVARDTPSVRLLLRHGAQVDGTPRTRSLGYIASRNDCGLLRELLQSGASVNGCDSDGRTALMDAAAWGRLESAQVLISHGADVNARDSGGNTALRFARMNKHRTLVRLLRQHSARE
jgi:ankyrin repeat protein